MDSVLVEVTRGDRVESVHHGHVAVVNAEGDLVAFSGDPESVSFFRSCGKPFQAVPLVMSGAADAFGFTTQHQDVARSMLRKTGRDQDSLQCGLAPPLDEKEGARVTLGLAPLSLVQCECSGAHAGMLATCQHMGWPVESYIESDHPLQRQVIEFLAAASGVAASTLEPATDGCSIPTYATSLRSIARAYATLADPDSAAWDGTQEQRQALLRLRSAMAAHPVMISEEGDVDTSIMQVTEGRVIAKLGAEGMVCLAIPEHGLGIAIRETSGASRALGPIAVAVLEALATEPPQVLHELREALVEPVRTFSGTVVGEVRPTVSLREA
jgi:L-asparaginase II